jgi:hypothetical protein
LIIASFIERLPSFVSGPETIGVFSGSLKSLDPESPRRPGNGFLENGYGQYYLEDPGIGLRPSTHYTLDTASHTSFFHFYFESDVISRLSFF